MTDLHARKKAVFISIAVSVMVHGMVLFAIFAIGREQGVGGSAEQLSVNLQEQLLSEEMPELKEKPSPTVVIHREVPIEALPQPEVLERPQEQFQPMLDLPASDLGFETSDLSITLDAGAIETGPVQVGLDFDSPQPAGDGKAEDLEMQHFQTVAKHIKSHLTYPQEAREQGIEGKVNVSMTLHDNGEVSQVKMTKSSGFDLLDQEALVIVDRATPLPTFGFKLIQNKGKRLHFEMVLNFTLKDM
ncbi:MAG: energy transducer TonB [Gammaproteobacteria bacterium]|nr:energy transducer TonB [Gammaproteobacteria bacterium]MYF52323.1 energy transducer TonB [Gammaproteobacteria bacterium]MYK42848.1 energy transducer TonB [Gammaproteobacteria bacterium]